MLNASNSSKPYQSIMDHLPLGLWRESFGSLFVVTAVATMFMNGCVLVMMNINKSLRTPSNIILAALAFVDLLTGATVAPLYAAQLLHVDVARMKYVEEVRRTIAAILILTSSNIVGFISFDRCLHLLKLSNYKLSPPKLYGGILCCWLIPALTPVLRFIHDDKEYAYSIAFNVELFGSLFIIFVFYFIIMMSLRRYARNHSSLVQQSYMENQKRATRTVAIILLFYILMNLPITVNRVFVIVGGMENDVLAKSYVIGSIFFVNSSVVNPVVYCLQTPLLRRKFVELFVRYEKNSRPHHDTTFTLTPGDSVQIHSNSSSFRSTIPLSSSMRRSTMKEGEKMTSEL